MNSIHVKILSYNAAADTFEVLREVTESGTVEVFNDTVPSRRILSDSDTKEMVDECRASGKSEMMTVPAGTFEVCRNVYYEGDAIGEVPFGYVIRPKPEADLKLVSFTRGNEIGASGVGMKNQSSAGSSESEIQYP
ncbi:MAG: hypothetical protein H7301_13165 [Cryobacterium sp.]|nr:hypothetical protein [Oligoflexia bacterium]